MADVNKIIYTDCDGVLLDWIAGAERYFAEKVPDFRLKDKSKYWLEHRYNQPKKDIDELVERFNESANIGWLSPYYDAVKYVKDLYRNYGFTFHVISSFSANIYSHRLRQKNLERLFGQEVFDGFTFKETHSSKEDILKIKQPVNLTWQKTYWIEDEPNHCSKGAELGYHAIFMESQYNRDLKTHPSVVRVTNWKEIYNLITK